MAMRGFKTGIYVPCAGKCLRTKQVKFRSSWELTFAKLLDRSDKIATWEFEQFFIGYTYLGKKRHYLVDFYVTLSNGDKYLIEIKPLSFFNKAMTTKDMNWHKWNAAMSYCADKNITFKVVTEATIPVLLRAWSNKSDSTLGTSLLY